MTGLRKSLGYIQAQFAEVLGVLQSTISRLETKKMNLIFNEHANQALFYCYFFVF